MQNQRQINVFALRARLQQLVSADGVRLFHSLIGLQEGMEETSGFADIRGVAVHSDSHITGDEEVWLVSWSGKVICIPETPADEEVMWIDPDSIRVFPSIESIPLDFYNPQD